MNFKYTYRTILLIIKSSNNKIEASINNEVIVAPKSFNTDDISLINEYVEVNERIIKLIVNESLTVTETKTTVIKAFIEKRSVL